MRFTIVAQVATLNTNLNGITGTYQQIYLADRIVELELVRAKSTVTTTGNMIRIFFVDKNGKLWIWDEITLASAAVGATVQSSEGEIVPTQPLVLNPGQAIYASTNNGEAVNVFLQLNDQVQTKQTALLTAELNA